MSALRPAEKLYKLTTGHSMLFSEGRVKWTTAEGLWRLPALDNDAGDNEHPLLDAPDHLIQTGTHSWLAIITPISTCWEIRYEGPPYVFHFHPLVKES